MAPGSPTGQKASRLLASLAVTAVLAGPALVAAPAHAEEPGAAAPTTSAPATPVAVAPDPSPRWAEGYDYAYDMTLGQAVDLLFAADYATSYAVTAGVLPAGISLDLATGRLTGTPTTVQSDVDFSLTASNAAGSITLPFQVTVWPAEPTWMRDHALPDFWIGEAYRWQLNAPRATSFVLADGALPAGISLDASGLLSGTATATPGAYRFTVNAVNEAGATPQAFTVTVRTVLPDAILTITPNFTAGDTLSTATFTFSGKYLTSNAGYDVLLDDKENDAGPVESTGTLLATTYQIPAHTTAGRHSLVLRAVSDRGDLVISEAWFSVTADGKIGAVSLIGPVANHPPTGVAPPAVKPPLAKPPVAERPVVKTPVHAPLAVTPVAAVSEPSVKTLASSGANGDTAGWWFLALLSAGGLLLGIGRRRKVPA